MKNYFTLSLLFRQLVLYMQEIKFGAKVGLNVSSLQR